MSELSKRRQRYKLSMFTRLHRILLVAVIIMAIFFFVSSWTFSNRLAEDYASNSWSTRWLLLDGWLTLLYFAVFVSISFIWRPTDNNRYLAMVDEISQDVDEAENYDLDALERQEEGKLTDDRDEPTPRVGQDEVVFEIGDDEVDDEMHTAGSHRTPRSDLSRERSGAPDEREGLMGSSGDNGHAKDRDE